MCIYYDYGITAKIMKSSEPEAESLSINELNDDCFLAIFSYLAIADIKSVEKVCTRWKGLCFDSWKAVEGLECRGSTWYLLAPNTVDRLYEVTCMNDLRESLKNCGQYMRYFRLSCHRSIDSAIFTSLLTTVPQFCKNLADIEIDSIQSPSSTEIRSIATNCINLEKLVLIKIDQSLEIELAELLNNNKKLKYLKLGGDNDFNRMTGKFLPCISRNTIEQLHIEKCYNLDQHFFSCSISHLKQLKFLNISHCTRITNDGIIGLAALNKLEILKMDCLWKVSDEPIGDLSSTLKAVHCGGCSNLKDSGIVKLIEKAPDLSFLGISFSSITNRTILAAIEVTRKRTNGIILNMDICETHANPTAITATSPFLKLINAQYNSRANRRNI